MKYFLRIRAICFLFSLIFSIFILTLNIVEYGRTYRFYSGFLCYRKDSESYFRWFQQEWLPSWPVNGGRGLPVLTAGYGLACFWCPFPLIGGFPLVCGNRTVRAEGTSWGKRGLSFPEYYQAGNSGDKEICYYLCDGFYNKTVWQKRILLPGSHRIPE